MVLLAENTGFHFAGTHYRVSLPLICMCWSPLLALGVLLRFFSLSANFRGNKVPRKLLLLLLTFYLAPAKPSKCSYSDTGLPWSHGFKLKSAKLLLTWQLGHLPGSKSEIGLPIHTLLNIYRIFGS